MKLDCVESQVDVKLMSAKIHTNCHMHDATYYICQINVKERTALVSPSDQNIIDQQRRGMSEAKSVIISLCWDMRINTNRKQRT